MLERCQTVTEVVYYNNLIYNISVNVKQAVRKVLERCQTVTEVVYHTIYYVNVKQTVRQAVKQLQK